MTEYKITTKTIILREDARDIHITQDYKSNRTSIIYQSDSHEHGTMIYVEPGIWHEDTITNNIVTLK